MRGIRHTVLALTVLMAVPLGAQEVERISGRSVAIYNLAGHVEVVRGSGSDVVVRITRGGADASALSIETGQIRGRSTLRIIYPDDEIVYRDMGRRSSTSINVRRDGTFSDGGNGRGDRVRIRGDGAGLEAWADLVIEVPVGNDFAVHLAVGEVEARGVEADVLINTGSGRVVATDIVGALDIETGSGGVVVRGVAGNLRVETGSGRVEVSDVSGREIEIETGSGGVRGVGLDADLLSVDTGSGSIKLEAVTSSEIVLDTGSGSIDIELTSDIEVLVADTGSGSVTVRAPSDLGAEVEIETGSGGIDLDFPLEVRSVRRNHVRGTIGDGRGRIEIDTGSGSVRLIRTGNETLRR